MAKIMLITLDNSTALHWKDLSIKARGNDEEHEIFPRCGLTQDLVIVFKQS